MPGSSARSRDGAGKEERLIVPLARAWAWAATVGRCMTEQETREGQSQKFYDDT